jgi:gluconate kinase
MLIIAGYSGSGKSTLASSLAAEFPARIIEVGATVRAEHANAGAPGTLVDFADDQFRRLGPTVFVAKAAAELTGTELDIVVGIRRPEEYRYLRLLAGAVRMVWLETSDSLRTARRVLRTADPTHRQYHRRRIEIERSWGLDSLAALADLVLDGSRPVAELTRGVHEWLYPRSSAPSGR